MRKSMFGPLRFNHSQCYFDDIFPASEACANVHSNSIHKRYICLIISPRSFLEEIKWALVDVAWSFKRRL